MDLLNIEPHVISESLTDKIFLFYGEAGTRKTSVAAQFDGHLIAAFEIGYKFMNGVYAKPVQKWTEFKRFVRALADPAVQEKYQTIIIDTISLAYSACYDYVLQQHGVEDPGDIGYGKGWRLIRKEFEKVILSIPQMGYGLVMIAHADDMSTETETRSKVDIDKRPAAIIKGLADFIFFVKKGFKEGEEQTIENLTVYAYSKLATIETKTRSRYFTPRFEFTYENLAQEMRVAIDTQKKVEGIQTVTEAESLNKLEEVDHEALREEIINITQELIETPASNMVYELLVKIFGTETKLTELSRIHTPQMQAAREELMEIKARL